MVSMVWLREKNFYFLIMEVRTKDIKVIKAKQQVEKVLEQYGIHWDDLSLKWYQLENDQKDESKEREVWEQLRGMLKKKGKRGPDPVKWQRKIRKEWDRKIL